jgi:hypothetical protein
VQAHAQLDVLHRARVQRRVEATARHEGVAADRAEAGPERRRLAGRAPVHVVVEQVAELRDRVAAGGLVVIGAEQRRQPRVGGERRADARERVGVDAHVGVDEHQHVAARLPRAAVARRRRPVAVAGDDDVVTGLRRRLDRGHRVGERRPRVRRRDDDAEGDRTWHRASL